jgi:glutamate/tyrosine decarboxylase-like PLP-dependent enzyme
MSPELFRKLGYEVVDSLADLYSSFGTRPVAAGVTPSEVRAALSSGGLPETGADPHEVLASATDLLFRTSTFNGHPKFLGYITAPAAPIGVLGELLAAGINANVGAWSLSPSATEIERQTIRWIAELIGFPVDCGGIFVSGGNMANMLCMLVARDSRLSRIDSRNSGERRLRLYASSETHTWIEKVVDLMGLGDGACRSIPVDGNHRMRLDALENAIADDKANGDTPLAVIGNAGTTNTGSIDPLRSILEICRKAGIWFHIDGAYGAPAAALPTVSDDLAVISEADSVSVDPHKWLYAPLEAGCALVRDEALLRQTFAHHPPYFHFAEPEGEPVFNFHEFGPQNSRGFRALKVWLALRQVGRAGYVKMIQDDIDLARLLYDRVSASRYLKAVTCELSVVTFGYVPPDIVADENAEYIDSLNVEILSVLEQNGSAYLSNAVVNGRFLLRACVVNFRTTAKDIAEVVDLVVKAGIEIDRRLRPSSLRTSS